jgi:UDP-glucose 4-epimerase
MESNILKHNNLTDKKPNRVVILGGNGFLGGAITDFLRTLEVNVLSLDSKELDLLLPDASAKLSKIINSKDVLIFISAKAPCRNINMFLENIQMLKAVCETLLSTMISHLVYISSDAVYIDSNKMISENSTTAPDSIHGIMHLAREIGLKNSYLGPLAIVRPTLVYGNQDPHNGYGPNRFHKLACKGEDIVLFGEGEEQRDHIAVEDVAKLVSQIVLRKSEGVINAVSGEVVTFKELAELAISCINSTTKLVTSQRKEPMPHNGFRAFNNSSIFNAFPDLKLKSWKTGLTQMYRSQNFSLKK